MKVEYCVVIKIFRSLGFAKLVAGLQGQQFKRTSPGEVGRFSVFFAGGWGDILHLVDDVLDLAVLPPQG